MISFGKGREGSLRPVGRTLVVGEVVEKEVMAAEEGVALRETLRATIFAGFDWVVDDFGGRVVVKED